MCVEGGALADAVGGRRDVGMAATGRKDVPSEESGAWGRAWTRPSERRESVGQVYRRGLQGARATRYGITAARHTVATGATGRMRRRGWMDDACRQGGGGHIVAWVVAPEMWLVWVSKVPSHELTQLGGGMT